MRRGGYISKQLVCQKYIYKLHSSRLRDERWELVLPLNEARRSDEIIALADSQLLRWIDELNGVKDGEAEIKDIRSEIKRLKCEPNNVQNKKRIRSLYEKLDNIQFKPDYMCLIIDKKSDYYRACKGFSINGIKYKRLLGTSGGVKRSTIVFVSERLCEELKRRIDNGRDMTKKLVPAKLEAYKALTCSASTPVTMPKGVLVVDDCVTTFLSDVVCLYDGGGREPEPIMEQKANQEITLDASDGCGMILPSLAEQWGEDLGLDYVMSGANTRAPFEKGVVFTFDFVKFAEEVAHSYIVRDVWGNDIDVRNVDLVLTSSMVKLWDSYKSCDDYLEKSRANGYTFSVTKVCPKELENERLTNYQYIQALDLDDADIEELIEPTITEIREALGGDWRKTVLFLKGLNLTDSNVGRLDDDYAKAMMIDSRMANDPYVRSCVYHLIKNRINEAKVGALKVHGNYSIVSGDPYALCQHMFGLEVTGLLGKGEVYNAYWAQSNSPKLACFRSPMSCHANIRLVSPSRSEAALKWYKHMNTCTIFNAWDTAMMALNGMDYDGDLVMLTDNPVIVRNVISQPALMCAQRKATKVVPTEEDFIRANIASFGNEVGAITNRTTSMYEARSRYPQDSEAYRTLTYRIQCGQLYQQGAIDRTKGIICEPMPKEWYDRGAANKIECGKKRDFYRSILVDRKPYFMRYIYPDLMRQYNTYIRNARSNALKRFRMTLDELKELPSERLSAEQAEFLKYYELKMPVGTGDCVMNKVCRRFEDEFDGCMDRLSNKTSFDYRFMKSEAEYSRAQYNAIETLYNDYNKRLRSYMLFINYECVDKTDSLAELATMNSDFERRCAEVCPNKELLCNIMLDMCYRRNSTKRFAWNMCGKEIIHNLLVANGNVIHYPSLDEDGDIEYCGRRFTIKTKELEGF